MILHSKRFQSLVPDTLPVQGKFIKDVYVETTGKHSTQDKQALAEYRHLYSFINKTEEVMVSVVSALVTPPRVCVPAAAQWLLG